MKRSTCFSFSLLVITCALVGTGAAAPSARETLSKQAPNVSAWALTGLEETVPPDIRRNLAFLREDLLDEAAQAPQASAASYKLGTTLCDALIAVLDEHDQTAVRAGYRAAQANANTKVTSADLEVRRNYKMSWTQYAKEQNQRTEIARQMNNQTALAGQSVRVEWANRVAQLRLKLDESYKRYREALRQDPSFQKGAASTPEPAFQKPSTPVATAPPAPLAQPVESGKAFENSLGMKFVPVPGTKVLFSIWDTRVQDYQAFVTATGRSWDKPEFEQGPTHPAVMVSWDDAKAFCAWMTEKERRAGTLTSAQEYRLPTDLEWSAAVGLENERGNTPQERHQKIKDVYPWGTQWPPPRGAGNYGAGLNIDEFEHASPVGSFPANRFGLYDMGGNVSQWCEDFFNGQSGDHLLRGGSWSDGLRDFLLSSSRRSRSTDFRRSFYGFRCVLAGGGVPASR